MTIQEIYRVFCIRFAGNLRKRRKIAAYRLDLVLQHGTFQFLDCGPTLIKASGKAT